MTCQSKLLVHFSKFLLAFPQAMSKVFSQSPGSHAVAQGKFAAGVLPSPHLVIAGPEMLTQMYGGTGQKIVHYRNTTCSCPNNPTT